MAITDIIILIALVPFVIQGITKGFVTQVVAIIALIAGIWASLRFTDLLFPALQPYLNVSEPVLKVITFVLIFLIVTIVLNLIGMALSKIIKLIMLGWLDKLLGIAFALLKGLLLIGVLIGLFEGLNQHLELVPQSVLDESVLYGPINKAMELVFPYLKGLIEQ